MLAPPGWTFRGDGGGRSEPRTHSAESQGRAWSGALTHGWEGFHVCLMLLLREAVAAMSPRSHPWLGALVPRCGRVFSPQLLCSQLSAQSPFGEQSCWGFPQSSQSFLGKVASQGLSLMC